MGRGEATGRLYELLEQLEIQIGGCRRVGSLTGQIIWPERGVCYFFEPVERRWSSGAGLRVVHVGTHAVSAGSKSRLWDRVRQHRGTVEPLGGNRPSRGKSRCIGSGPDTLRSPGSLCRQNSNDIHSDEDS